MYFSNFCIIFSKFDWFLQGMTCGGCAASVKRILESQVNICISFCCFIPSPFGWVLQYFKRIFFLMVILQALIISKSFLSPPLLLLLLFFGLPNTCSFKDIAWFMIVVLHWKVKRSAPLKYLPKCICLVSLKSRKACFFGFDYLWHVWMSL